MCWTWRVRKTCFVSKSMCAHHRSMHACFKLELRVCSLPGISSCVHCNFSFSPSNPPRSPPSGANIVPAAPPSPPATSAVLSAGLSQQQQEGQQQQQQQEQAVFASKYPVIRGGAPSAVAASAPMLAGAPLCLTLAHAQRVADEAHPALHPPPHCDCLQ